MAKKASKPAIEIRDWEHCNGALGNACLATTLLRDVESTMNEELVKVRERYEKALATHGGNLAELERAVEVFSVKHRADFGGSKSKELTHGTLHFRVTPPAVRTLNRKWTWGSILDTVVSAGRSLASWVRTKQEIDKEAILAEYAARKVSDSDLAEFGLRVVQEERFDIEYKLDEVPYLATS